MRSKTRYQPLAYLAVILSLALALVETWALVRRPWEINATLGGTDAALLGEGFYTKEVTRKGIPFRWTQDQARIMLPWTQPAYRVILGAETAVTATHRLVFDGCGVPIMAVDVQPGFHYYQLVWVPQCQRAWPGGLGSADLLLLTESRQVLPSDDRALGISVSQLYVRGLGIGPFSLAPLLIVALSMAALALLLSPWSWQRLLVLGGLAAGLPLLWDLLAWHPPVGADYTWLPVAWLPGLVAVALLGLVLVRVVVPARHGAPVAALLVGLLFLGVLLNLYARWNVQGPDYGWHLSHGGSWERVFRAHGYYPFGFPLVLWLGELWGGQALAMGRTVCLLATLATFAATVALAWRLRGRESDWLVAVLFLASPFLVAYGVLASSDALLMAMATLSLLVLCWSERLRVGQVLLAGLLLGLAYLFRHQALLMGAAPAIWLLFGRVEEQDLPPRFRWLRRLGRFLPLLLFGVGFLVGSAPQWVLDIRDTGRPFFSQQYANIWHFAYNRFDSLPTSGNALWFLLNFDPPTLWRSLLAHLQHILQTTIHTLLIWPVGLLALFGLAAAVLHGPGRRGRLLFLWTGFYFVAVALTVDKERFFLPVVPALVVLVALFLSLVQDRLAAAGKGWPLLYQAIQVGLWCLIWVHLLAGQQELALYSLNAAVFP